MKRLSSGNSKRRPSASSATTAAQETAVELAAIKRAEGDARFRALLAEVKPDAKQRQRWHCLMQEHLARRKDGPQEKNTELPTDATGPRAETAESIAEEKLESEANASGPRPETAEAIVEELKQRGGADRIGKAIALAKKLRAINTNKGGTKEFHRTLEMLYVLVSTFKSKLREHLMRLVETMQDHANLNIPYTYWSFIPSILFALNMNTREVEDATKFQGKWRRHMVRDLPANDIVDFLWENVRVSVRFRHAPDDPDESDREEEPVDGMVGEGHECAVKIEQPHNADSMTTLKPEVHNPSGTVTIKREHRHNPNDVTTTGSEDSRNPNAMLHLENTHRHNPDGAMVKSRPVVKAELDAMDSNSVGRDAGEAAGSEKSAESENWNCDEDRFDDDGGSTEKGGSEPEHMTKKHKVASDLY